MRAKTKLDSGNPSWAPAEPPRPLGVPNPEAGGATAAQIAEKPTKMGEKWPKLDFYGKQNFPNMAQTRNLGGSTAMTTNFGVESGRGPLP